MGNRRFTAGKRFVAALALIVATPALGPALRIDPLAIDPLDNWTVTFGQGVDAADLLLALSTAGIPFVPDALDRLDVTLAALEGEGILDATYSAAFAGRSQLAGSGGSTPSSLFDSGTSGTNGGSQDGKGIAADGDGSSGPRGSANSPTSPTSFADDVAHPPAVITDGRNSRYFGPGRDIAPPGSVALIPLPTGSHPGGMSWHDPIIATGLPGVIVKDGDIPVPGDLNDPTNPGNGGLPGPFIPDNGLPPSYPNDGPPGFAPSNFVSADVAISAVPEPGTLALLALGLVGLALARRKP